MKPIRFILDCGSDVSHGRGMFAAVMRAKEKFSTTEQHHTDVSLGAASIASINSSERAGEGSCHVTFPFFDGGQTAGCSATPGTELLTVKH